MTLYKMFFPIEEGDMVMAVGVHPLAWNKKEEPTMGFTEASNEEILEAARKIDGSLFIDDDGYVTMEYNYPEGKVTWNLQSDGWRAFYKDDPIYETLEITSPNKGDIDTAYIVLCQKVELD